MNTSYSFDKGRSTEAIVLIHFIVPALLFVLWTASFLQRSVHLSFALIDRSSGSMGGRTDLEEGFQHVSDPGGIHRSLVSACQAVSLSHWNCTVHCRSFAVPMCAMLPSTVIVITMNFNDLLNTGHLGGALSAVRTHYGRSATIWACGRTGDRYFVRLGGHHCCLRVGFDTSSTLGMAFLDFHLVSPISTFFHTFLLISTTSTLS